MVCRKSPPGARAVASALCAGQGIKGGRHGLDRGARRRGVENRRARLVTEILASAAYDSTAARVKAFVEQQGGCRATFFNYRAGSATGAGMRLGSAKDTTSVQGRYRGGGVGAATSRVDNSAALLFNSRCK